MKALDKQYTYTDYTPSRFSHKGIEYALYPEEKYFLPDTGYVRGLIAQGKLVEYLPPVKSASEAPKPTFNKRTKNIAK